MGRIKKGPLYQPVVPAKKRRELSEAFKKHIIKPGEVRNPKGGPKGWKPAHIQLREAIQDQIRLGRDPIRVFVEKAQTNPMLMKALLDKMVANKIQIGLGPDDLTDIINSVVGIIGKHVKDHAIREAIAKDLEELEFDE